jgi:acyl-CoA thioester hydrolase
MATDFVHRLRVRFGECDPQGVVFNANYLLYLDVAFTELWRERLGGYAEMIGRGIDVMLVQSNLSYRRAARADDLIDVRLRVAALGTTSVTMEAAVERDGETLVEATLVHVFVDAASLEKTAIPADVRALLAPA